MWNTKAKIKVYNLFTKIDYRLNVVEIVYYIY